MRKLCLLSLAILGVLSSNGNVRMPNVLSSNMVLQQHAQASLWGWCEPGEKITITTSWDNRIDSLKGTRDGNWRFPLATPAPADPIPLL